MKSQRAGKAARDVAGDTGRKFLATRRLTTIVLRNSTTPVRGSRALRQPRPSGLLKARDWIKENPGKAAVVSVSLVLGIRAGAAFPGLDAVLLGSHPHWLTHSALPVYGLTQSE